MNFVSKLRNCIEVLCSWFGSFFFPYSYIVCYVTYVTHIHTYKCACKIHLYVYIITCIVAFMTRLHDNCNGHFRNAQPHYSHIIS